jgi:hypothetical protein
VVVASAFPALFVAELVEEKELEVAVEMEQSENMAVKLADKGSRLKLYVSGRSPSASVHPYALSVNTVCTSSPSIGCTATAPFLGGIFTVISMAAVGVYTRDSMS